LAVSDLYRTNFYKFYRRFEEIGLLEVEAVLICLQDFGLDVLLGIDGNSYLILNIFLMGAAHSNPICFNKNRKCPALNFAKKKGICSIIFFEGSFKITFKIK